MLLFLKLCLGGGELLTGGFRRLPLLGQSLGSLCHFPGSGFQGIQAGLVSLVNLGNHPHLVQKLRKGAGVEQDGPVGKAVVLFHGADPVPVLLLQFGELCLGGVQLLLLVGNQQIVGGNLLVDGILFLTQQENLLLQHALFCDEGIQPVALIRKPCLELIPLGLQVLFFGLQLSNLLLQGADVICLGPVSADEHISHQHQGQKPHKKPAD